MHKLKKDWESIQSIFLSKSSLIATMKFGGVFMATYADTADTLMVCSRWWQISMFNIGYKCIKESFWNLPEIQARTKYHNTNYHNCNFRIMSGNNKIHLNKNIASCKTQRRGFRFFIEKPKSFNFCIASCVWLWAVAKSAPPPIQNSTTCWQSWEKGVGRKDKIFKSNEINLC